MCAARLTPAGLSDSLDGRLPDNVVPFAVPDQGEAAEPADAVAARRFVLQLARALHQHGTPAHRLEAALSSAATQLGLKAVFFSTPTSIMVGIGELEHQRVHLLRVEPGEPNLGQLARLAEITRRVVDNEIAPSVGLAQLDAIDREPPTYDRWLVVLAFMLSSAAVATFLKVRAGEVAVASVLGLVTAIITVTTNRWASTRPINEPLAAFVVTSLAFMVDGVLRTKSGYATSLAGLVILLPGLTFTVALTELSTRHLASGTARLSGALVVFLGLGFGLALGAKVGAPLGNLVHDLLPMVADWRSRAALPTWSEWVALVVAPLAFTVLLKAPPRDAPLIVIACAAAYLTSKFAGAAMGEELGAFLGAFVVSAGSNVLARVKRRVAMVTQVPGLLILVPGSIGFRSVTSLLGQEVETGIATAFRLAIIGTSLAAGILAGNVVTRSANRMRV